MGSVVRILFRILRRQALTIQPGFAQSNLKQIGTSAIILPRRFSVEWPQAPRAELPSRLSRLPQPREDGARLPCS